MKKLISIRIEEITLEVIQKIAKEQQRSIGYVVNQILKNNLFNSDNKK